MKKKCRIHIILRLLIYVLRRGLANWIIGIPTLVIMNWLHIGNDSVNQFNPIVYPERDQQIKTL